MFNLSGYKPESPTDSDFSPFKYEGTVRFNYARISKAEKANDYGTSIGDEIFEVEVEIISGDFAKRKLWKKFNLDSNETSGKAKKTAVQKLADQLFACGLEFNTSVELVACAGKLVDTPVNIKAYPIKIKDKKTNKTEEIQMWNLKGFATEGQEENVPDGTTAKVPF